ncbi:hypothetical protein B0H21DRAFT_742791 [Amylocystis lapponica]|nr:hypothetical protein B0H21DRAFT_742791 [Amylocystis lapponica]
MLPLSALLNPSGTPPGASVPHSSVTINHPPPDPFVSLDTMPPRVRSGALRRTVAVDPTPSMSGSPARHTSHRPPHNAVATSPMAFEGRVSPLPPPMNKGKGKAVDRGEPQSPSTVPVQGLAAAVQNVPGEGVPTGLEEDADFEFDEEFEDEDHPVYRYPPVAPFDADDPAWVHKMMDTLRQQHEDVAEHARTAHTRMAEATVELALARAELEEETRQMDEFLAAVGAEAGPSFLRYLMWRFEQDEDDAEAPHESYVLLILRVYGG